MSGASSALERLLTPRAPPRSLLALLSPGVCLSQPVGSSSKVSSHGAEPDEIPDGRLGIARHLRDRMKSGPPGLRSGWVKGRNAVKGADDGTPELRPRTYR